MFNFISKVKDFFDGKKTYMASLSGLVPALLRAAHEIGTNHWQGVVNVINSPDWAIITLALAAMFGRLALSKATDNG